MGDNLSKMHFTLEESIGRAGEIAVPKKEM